MLEKLFRLDEHRTTVRIEIIAGATTYLTMAYIDERVGEMRQSGLQRACQCRTLGFGRDQKPLVGRMRTAPMTEPKVAGR